MEGGKNHRRELGRLGEELTCDYLRRHGHSIIERNWRSGHLEIDIISHDADGIHFVEVKARKESIQAPPQDNVGLKKQRRIVKAALSYLNNICDRSFGASECFFDVMAVTFADGDIRLEWIPQAYIPIYI